MSDPATPEGAIPANLQSRLNSIPELPPQGFAPHVELDENGRIVFAPPAALDAEGNNLRRLRSLLPELIATADALRDLLARGNQAHAALIRRLAAYRAQLHTDLAQVPLARVLAEGIRLENAAAAARTQIAAGELPPHDEEAEETLESLLRFNRMFVMATAEGPAMLADEARYRRTPEEDSALQATLIQFAATAAQDPAALAPDVAETLTATISQTGDSQEATRARRLGEGLTGNILITATYAATLAAVAAYTAAAAGVAPAGLLGWLGYKTIEKTKAYAATIEAGAKVLDMARDLDPKAAVIFARDRLAHAANFISRTRSSVQALAQHDNRFSWLAKPLEWLQRQENADAQTLGDPEWEDDDFWERAGSNPPEGFSEAEVRRLILANEPVPDSWCPFVRELNFSLRWLDRMSTGEPLRQPLERVWAERPGEVLRTANALARFPNLAKLGLARTPVSDIAPLAGLAHLQRLDLDSTQVSDLAPLAGLASLQALTLDNTQVSDIAPLAGLASLQALTLDNTQVSDIAPLAGLTSLQTLYLDSPQVSNLASLAELASLETLTLNTARVSDLAPLTGLANLHTLYLDSTQVSDLAPLAGLASLQTLSLRNTQVFPDLAPLAGLASLQTLYLNNARVSDLAPLAGLASLQTLNLSETQVSDLAPLASLASLQTLHLDYNQVSDLTPLASLANLQTLTLDSTRVSNLAPLAGLASLQRLDLDSTQVSDLAPLTGLASLQTLNLSETQVSDLAPLASLASLRMLALNDTQVSNLAPLAGLASLQTVILNGLPEGIEAALPRRAEISIVR